MKLSRGKEGKIQKTWKQPKWAWSRNYGSSTSSYQSWSLQSYFKRFTYLYTNRSFGQLLKILPTNFISLKKLLKVKKLFKKKKSQRFHILNYGLLTKTWLKLLIDTNITIIWDYQLNDMSTISMICQWLWIFVLVKIQVKILAKTKFCNTVKNIAKNFLIRRKKSEKYVFKTDLKKQFNKQLKQLVI